MRGLIANAHDIRMDGPALPRLFQKIGVEMIAAIAIPFLLLMLAALGGNLIQHQLVWSLEVLAPKFSKISPVAGFKRLFSKQALANLAKGLVKLVLVGGVLTALMWPERGRHRWRWSAPIRRRSCRSRKRWRSNCWARWSP